MNRSGIRYRSWNRCVYRYLIPGLVAGCTSLPRATTPARQETFDAPVERVWDAALEALASSGYTVRRADQASGRLLADQPLPTRALREVASDVSARLDPGWWGADATLAVTLSPLGPSQTRVTADTRLMARTSPMIIALKRSRPALVPMTSNGTLERRYLDALARSLAGGPPWRRD